MSSASLPAEASAGLSTRWAVARKHQGVYTDSAAKVVLSPLTGRFLASWCSGDVSLLELSTGSLLGKLAAGDEEIEDQFSSFDISPNEEHVVTVSRKSGLIKIWDVKECREISSWKCAHQMPVLDIAYSSTGYEIATCSADKTIVVYSVQRNGIMTHKFMATATKPGHKTRVVKLFWHPNPKRAELFSCSEDGEVRIWKLKDSSSVLLENHMGLVTSVAFSKDGDTLITGGRDKVVNVWSIGAGESYGKHKNTIPVYELVEGLVVLAQKPTANLVKGRKSESSNKRDELFFTTAGSKGVLRTWSTDSLECVAEKALPTLQGIADPSEQLKEQAEKYIANQVAHLLRIPASSGLKSAPAASSSTSSSAASHEDRLIAVTQEQNFYIYSAVTFRREQLLLGFNDEIIDLKCHPDNNHVLMASNSSQIRILHLNTLTANLISGHMDTVLALDISPCGRYIVSSSKDTTVRFWHLNDLSAATPTPEADEDHIAKCVAIGEGHTESVGCVTFNRNKHLGKLFAVSGARERIIKLWNCTPFYKSNSSEAIAAAALKAKGSGAQHDSALRLTAAASRLAHEKDINCLECSPNDKLVASGSEDKTIRIWDSSDLSPKAVLKGHRRGVWCIRFSTVDKVLASASGDKTIKLWNMDDFTCLKTFEGHTASVKQVLFINAGMQLLSCGDDAVVKLWTIKTSECVNTFADAHDSKIWAMSLSSDGRKLVTGGSDSVLNIWEDVSASDIEAAEAERESFLAQEQTLSNLIRSRQFNKAVGMCLELEQPRKCYTVVQEMLLIENKQATTSEPVISELPAIIRELGDQDELLSRFISYIRDWNTHAKTSYVAQHLLSHLFRSLPPTQLQANRSLLQQASSLNLYSERHFNRIDKLLTKSYIMDYMLQAMKTVEPEADSKDEKAVTVKNEANHVIAHLLSTTVTTAHSQPIFTSAAGPSVSASAKPMEVDEEEGGFSDDDGSAWATNWQDASSEPEEEKEPEVTNAKQSNKQQQQESKKQGEKRKQPTSSPSLSSKKSPALAPAANPTSKKQKQDSSKASKKK